METEQAGLEQIVDRIGIQATINYLADVCDDKASHIAEAWQERERSHFPHADCWRSVARRLSTMASCKTVAAIAESYGQ
jgi:hypothetical protein